MEQGNSRRSVQRIFLGVGIAALAVMLTGCASSQGLTPLEARDRVEAAPGVASATVTTGEEERTLKTTYFVRVRVQMEREQTSEDLSRLVEYVSRVGWATRIGHTPTGMQLNFSGPGDVDAHAILEGLGVKSSPGFSNASVLVSAKTLNDKWGRWPSEVPKPLK